MDDLSFELLANKNQLGRVGEASTAFPSGDKPGFEDATDQPLKNYTYNDAGSLTQRPTIGQHDSLVSLQQAIKGRLYSTR